jgi:hypothetical protein
MKHVSFTRQIKLTLSGVMISIVLFALCLYILPIDRMEAFQRSGYDETECGMPANGNRCQLKRMNANFPVRYGVCFKNAKGNPWCHDILDENNSKLAETKPDPPIVKAIQAHIPKPPPSESDVNASKVAVQNIKVQKPKLPPAPADPAFTDSVRAYLAQVIKDTNNTNLTLTEFQILATIKYNMLDSTKSTDPKGRAIPDKQFFEDTYKNIQIIKEARFKYYMQHRV